MNERDEVMKEQSSQLEAWLNPLISDYWEDILRLTLESHGAVARCQRRACKLSKQCHLAYKLGTPLHCGGDVSLETVQAASLAAYVGCMMLSTYDSNTGRRRPNTSRFLYGAPDTRKNGSAQP